MKRMILAGGSGFLGQLLASHFQSRNWEVVNLTRKPARSSKGDNELNWDGRTLGHWQAALEGAAAVINLSGKSVNCRYTPINRQQILESRVNSTLAIGEAMVRCANPSRVWLNASTATIYKHSLERAMDEEGEIGPTAEAKDAFSVEVATAWEEALEGAVLPGVRKVAMRTAMVLGCGRNSVFPMLRRLVRFGLGGKMGDGKQFVSWIHEGDFCGAVEWLITHDELSGAINLASQNPVTNAEMMTALREINGMPTGLPATNWMLELGAVLLRTETELILKSRKVIPGRLLRSGFQFQFPLIADAFRELNNRPVSN